MTRFDYLLEGELPQKLIASVPYEITQDINHKDFFFVAVAVENSFSHEIAPACFQGIEARENNIVISTQNWFVVLEDIEEFVIQALKNGNIFHFQFYLGNECIAAIRNK